MAKRPVKKMKVTKNKGVAVKAVVLPKGGVVQVAVPAGVVPVVAVDPVRRIVEIAPVPATKKRTWWQSIFGE